MATRPQALHEAVASLALAGRTGSGRLRVRIIEADRWGSSAYYPATVLKRDGSVFKAGTHTYFDHPTVTEAVERPERSVRDLAGRLVTDAEFDGDGLYAEMEVFPHYRDLVESMAGAIGLSIRAQGTVEYGEMAGRSGPILTAFTEAESVDFVTAPGAGGKIVALLESARVLAEGRHSAPWREEDHPRGDHGRFGNGSGSGGSDGGSGGGSAGGAPSGAPASRSERGMPSVLSTTSVPLAGGGSARLDRHTSGDISLTAGTHTTTLSRDNADTLVSRLRLADDWDVGDEESFGGAGHIRKTGRSEYEATLPDGTALNVTRRDVKQLEKAFDRLDGASRVDTGNGDTDIFVTDDKKIGFRHLGDDGRPVEAAFTRGSFGKISRTIDELIDEADFPDDPDNPITLRVIATNLGKVRVELLGGLRDGPGSRLEIMPVEGDAWGVVVDSAQKYDWFHAMDQAASASGLTEARRSPAAEVPRGKAPPFQKTKDDDEDPDEQDEDDKGDEDEDEDGKPPVFLKSREAARQLRRILADLRTSRTPLTEARNVGAWIESRLHLTLTQLADDMYGDGRLTRPERISLSSAVGDALTTFTTRIAAEQPQLFRRDLGDQPPAAVTEADRLREGHGLTAGDLGDALSQTVKDAYGGRDIWVWVRDHTDDWVVFSLESAADCGLYQQAYTVAPDGTLTLTGDAAEVTARTTYTPKPGAPTAAENGLGIPPTTHTNKEGEMPELTEAEARQLTEARDQADAARQAAEQQAATAARELARFHALEAARPIAVTILAESGLPPAAQARLLATVTAESVPLGESNQLDEAALRTAVSEAAASEARYLASLAEADGAGRVRGLGESTAQGEPADSAAAAATTTGLVEAYKSRGLSEEAARLAAAGRPF